MLVGKVVHETFQTEWWFRVLSRPIIIYCSSQTPQSGIHAWSLDIIDRNLPLQRHRIIRWLLIKCHLMVVYRLSSLHSLVCSQRHQHQRSHVWVKRAIELSKAFRTSIQIWRTLPKSSPASYKQTKLWWKQFRLLNQRKLAFLVACCLSEDKINYIQKVRIASCISVHPSCLKTKRYENFRVCCYLTPDAKSGIRSIETSPHSWSVTDNGLCPPRCSDSINLTNVLQWWLSVFENIL